MLTLPLVVLCVVQPVTSPSEASLIHGRLAPPEYRLTYSPGGSLRDYHPQPGDVVFSTTDKRIATARYALALTWRPTHVGIVVRMPGGELGVLEAGGGDSHLTRTTALPDRFSRATDKAIWVRQPLTPLTAEQSASLSQFAETLEGRPYASLRQNLLGTVFRARGPIRTMFIGGPKGLRDDYICSEAVLESLVWSGVINAETARPSATFPRDMFFDRSPNPYIHAHPPLKCGWKPPALWVKDCAAICPGMESAIGPVVRDAPTARNELLERFVGTYGANPR
jgi:hypothetical protein